MTLHLLTLSLRHAYDEEYYHRQRSTSTLAWCIVQQSRGQSASVGAGSCPGLCLLVSGLDISLTFNEEPELIFQAKLRHDSKSW